MAGRDARLEVEIRPIRTAEERAAVFALRMEVFVDEQRVPVEEELDAYDVTATHFLVRVRRFGDDVGAIVGTARLVNKGAGVGKIGRVAISSGYRGLGLGAALMRAIHAYGLENGLSRMHLEAQCYAIGFYERLGYVAEGEIFLDANIEHRHMWAEMTPLSKPAIHPSVDETAPSNPAGEPT